MFKLFKKRGNTMQDEVKVEETKTDEAVETKEETKVEETLETKTEETKVETKVEPKANDSESQEKTIVEEKVDFTEQINALSIKFDEKIAEIDSKYTKVLEEKDKTIADLTKKVEELERTAPNMGVLSKAKGENTLDERDIQRKKVVDSYYGN
jgi:hypothetical protein